MKIFVTGGAGFVGQYLVHSLLNNGHKVTIFDNLSNATKSAVLKLERDGASFVKGDVASYKNVFNSSHNFDFVIHLAAKTNVEESIVSPELTHLVNVTGTINLLKACIVNKIPNIIIASSAAVYGDSKKMPFYENSVPIPISPYGATKLAIEYYLKAFSNCFPINSVSLRFFNIYGLGQSTAYAGVIDRFMTRVAHNKPPIIFGDGKNTRDFVSIEDIVQAISLAMKKINRKKGDVYNIATGTSVSINELAKLIISISGKKLQIIHKKPKTGEIRHSIASIALAKRDLGYTPKVRLKDGIKRLMQVASN
ncbi:MAG: NAD-dependent epimerase/dehydratase family protein [Nitrosotalea sp.]